MKLAIEYAGASHRGRIRKENQDCYGKFPEDNNHLDHPTGQLLVVADGMGGHLGGQEASRLAVETLARVVTSDPPSDFRKRLQQGFEAANRVILEKASQHLNLQGMGTTCTALLLHGQAATVAHVGDSRAYLIQASGWQRLTQDHSHVAEMQRQGILTEQEARAHPHRSVLTRALGILPSVSVDYQEISFEVGDLFLLCSDGLLNVPEDTLHEVAVSQSPKEACSILISLANQAGGEDNVTVLIARIVEKPD